MTTPIALSRQLVWVARCVEAVEQGRSLNDAMPRVPAELRPGVQALTFHALRHWGQARALIALLAPRPPKPAVSALLGVALTLLVRPKEGEPDLGYAAHTVVDQAVEALGQARGGAGFVNACLRRFLREQAALESEAEADAVARWNHPFWWVQRIRKEYPQQWQGLLAANNQPAPMVLRVNRRQCTQAAYLQALADLGVAASPWGESGVVLERAQPVEQLPGWNEGWVSVQDGAAQLAAPLLLDGAALQPGARVLDACAAPGGKTAHLLELADLDVLALELDARRADRIRDNLNRLGLQARLKVADAGAVDSWWDGQWLDAILLDAPCTASGIVRRHPDVRWLRRPEDVAQLAAQQKRLLEALWPTLRPGGRLLYCTCSVFKAEGEQQIDAFLQRHPEALALPAPGHLRPGQQIDTAINDNRSSGIDGFFYALLLKQPID